MAHWILVLFLIGNLLACPLRCLAADCQPVIVDAVESARCNCCESSPAPAEVPVPTRAPSNDCTCADCLCDGAVIEAEAQYTGSGGGAWIVFIFADQSVAESQFGAPKLASPLPNHRLFHGAAARVALQSWLL